jgi:1-acyl-sn-glycerol-3-phosphate acyltransferase
LAKASSPTRSSLKSSTLRIAKSAWYQTLRVLIGIAACLMFKIRTFGGSRLPREGGALLASNHQSHLDPPLIGQAVPRRINYLARKTLFKFFLFRWLIQSLDAIPIDRGGSGIGGIKETMRRLKRGEQVLMFPEGTRTPDGDMRPLKPGFCAMVRRSKVPIIPIAIDGSFQAWPRSSKFPQRGVIHIHIGEPIAADLQADLSDDQLVTLVQQRIADCLANARASRARVISAR